jgi:hypothetical protein
MRRRYAKIGTESGRVVLVREHNVKIGDRIHFRERVHGSKWETGLVDGIKDTINGEMLMVARF